MARLAPENAERRLRRHTTSSTTPLRVRNMTSIELSLFIEANYPATATSISQRKPRYGVGINDSHYVTQPIVNGKQIVDPAYRAWAGMLIRAYDQKFHAKCPTYVGVTVYKEWHSFSAFRAWWLANYRDGFSLDKDLLVVGNREYGPEACIYVPQSLNTFTIDRGALRGDLPIGVCLDKSSGKYQSWCCNPITGKQNNLGRFTTPEEAHKAWLTYKLKLADKLKPEMDAIDLRIYHNVLTIVKAAV